MSAYYDLYENAFARRERRQEITPCTYLPEKDLYPKGVCGTYRNFPTSAQECDRGSIGCLHWRVVRFAGQRKHRGAGRTRILQHFTEMLARDRREKKEKSAPNPSNSKTYTCASAARSATTSRRKWRWNVYTPLPRKSKKVVETTEENKKSRTETVPQAECMYQQERIHPIERTNQTCRHRRAEQIHPARVPAPPRNGKVNGLCAARKRHSKTKFRGANTETQRHRN